MLSNCSLSALLTFLTLVSPTEAVAKVQRLSPRLFRAQLQVHVCLKTGSMMLMAPFWSIIFARLTVRDSSCRLTSAVHQLALVWKMVNTAATNRCALLKIPSTLELTRRGIKFYYPVVKLYSMLIFPFAQCKQCFLLALKCLLAKSFLETKFLLGQFWFCIQF